MLRLGLTGGIGAGKSTVASALEELGAVVIDADKIAREVVEPGTEGLAEIVAAFGEAVLDDEGALDRPALAEKVFADDEARATLNGIVHPRVGGRTAELVAEAPEDGVVVHDIPLLVENGMGAAFQLVLVVDAPVDVRVDRLSTARGMPVEDARARIQAQADDDARRAAADVWLDNSGPAGAVREQVERLWTERIVPLEANLRTRTATPAPTGVVAADPEWAEQGRRIAARLAVATSSAGDAAVERIEHVGPTAVPGLPAPDVLDLLVLRADGRRLTRRRTADAVRETLGAAGYPHLGDDRHGSSDPGRPARVRVVPASSDEARAILAARDAARADPDLVASDPDGVRAQVGV